MPGLSRHNVCDGGWCGEGELNSPLYPIRDLLDPLFTEERFVCHIDLEYMLYEPVAEVVKHSLRHYPNVEHCSRAEVHGFLLKSAMLSNVFFEMWVVILPLNSSSAAKCFCA